MGTRSRSWAPGLIDRATASSRDRFRRAHVQGITNNKPLARGVETRRASLKLKEESPASAKEVGAGRRPDHRQYPQHSSVFCPRAARALPPFRFYHSRSADWSPNCWGAVRGINRSGADACLRARNGMAQKASEARSGLRLSKSGLDGRQPFVYTIREE